MSKASLELGGGNWGTKDGNLLAYAQGNESSNLVPREFTFTRGSDIAATRINSSGVIEKYRENLLLHSNQFDTTWTTTSSTLTSGQSGYDGSSDAWLLEATSSSARVIQNNTTSGVQTFSCYAKSGTADYLAFYNIISGSAPRAWFNLSNGTIQNNNHEIDANIESIGNGWYRCSLTYNATLSNARIYVAREAGNFNTILGDNIYIQDAQLEQGLVATNYLESGATTATSGVADNEPRIDYAGGTASLLLEPSRTNLITNSEYFEGTGWTAQAGITLTPNTTETLSPEGLNNAYKVVSTDATKGFYISGLNVTNDAVRTIYLKGSVGGETIVFKDPSGFGTPSTKTLTTDWQRFEMATTNDGNTYQGLFIDDISVGTIYAFGAQLEEGSYPTSYIPTYGTSVTRNADSLGKYDLADSTSQTVFFQFKNVGYAGGGGEIVIEKANPVAAIFRIYAQATSGGVVLVQFRTEFPIQTYTFNTGKQTSEVQKVAFSISGTTAKAYCNGQLKHTFTVTETEMQVLNWRVQNTKYNTDNLLLFPTALTDRELVDLTSPYSTYQELVTAEGLTWESPTCTTNSITELQSI